MYTISIELIYKTHQHTTNFRTTIKHTILTELVYKIHLPAHDQFQNYHKTYNIGRTDIQITLTSTRPISELPQK
jgi:hypothetical protein